MKKRKRQRYQMTTTCKYCGNITFIAAMTRTKKRFTYTSRGINCRREVASHHHISNKVRSTYEQQKEIEKLAVDLLLKYH